MCSTATAAATTAPAHCSLTALLLLLFLLQLLLLLLAAGPVAGRSRLFQMSVRHTISPVVGAGYALSSSLEIFSTSIGIYIYRLQAQL
jgi:hypothetical protein